MITQTKHHQMVRKPLGAERDGLVDIISCDWCACRTCQSTGSGLRFVFCRKSLSVVTLSRLLPSVWRTGLKGLSCVASADVKIQGSPELFLHQSCEQKSQCSHKDAPGKFVEFSSFQAFAKKLGERSSYWLKNEQMQKKRCVGARGRPNLDFYVWVIKFSSWAKLP